MTSAPSPSGQNWASCSLPFSELSLARQCPGQGYPSVRIYVRLLKGGGFSVIQKIWD